MEKDILEGKLHRKLKEEEAQAVHYWNQNGHGISADKWKEVKELYKNLCAEAGVELDRDPLASEQDVVRGNSKKQMIFAIAAFVVWSILIFIAAELI